jgi:hypothetical protein
LETPGTKRGLGRYMMDGLLESGEEMEKSMKERVER